MEFHTAIWWNPVLGWCTVEFESAAQTTHGLVMAAYRQIRKELNDEWSKYASEYYTGGRMTMAEMSVVTSIDGDPLRVAWDESCRKHNRKRLGVSR